MQKKGMNEASIQRMSLLLDVMLHQFLNLKGIACPHTLKPSVLNLQLLVLMLRNCSKVNTYLLTYLRPGEIHHKCDGGRKRVYVKIFSNTKRERILGRIYLDYVRMSVNSRDL